MLQINLCPGHSYKYHVLGGCHYVPPKPSFCPSHSYRYHVLGDVTVSPPNCQFAQVTATGIILGGCHGVPQTIYVPKSQLQVLYWGDFIVSPHTANGFPLPIFQGAPDLVESGMVAPSGPSPRPHPRSSTGAPGTRAGAQLPEGAGGPLPHAAELTPAWPETSPAGTRTQS